VSSVTAKKTTKAAVSKPSPREKLQIKTKLKDDDWYETAFKRFSISLNRTNQLRDPLASVSPPIKADFK
jgi:hypothetical protein